MRIALISTMNLPTPAVKGGAVEMLTTHIIEENEKYRELYIDLYTIYDAAIDQYKYSYTNIIQIKTKKIERLLQKIVNFKNRILRNKKVYNISYQKLAKIVSNNKYDRIVIENNMFVYKVIQKKTNIPLIYHIHNDFNDYDKTIDNYKLIASSVKTIIAVSEYIKSRLNSVEKFKNIEVLLNAIDKSIYNINKAKSLRNKYQIEGNDIVIGYTGRITREKGVLELIKSIKMINVNKNIKLLIVGSQWYGKLENDEYMMRVQSEIDNIRNDVIFTGYIDQNEMPNLYKTMDILVIPSLCEEAFGCVAIEAMAMGLPVISAKSGGLKEIIKDDFGYIIEKDENFISNISYSIEKLVNDDDLRNKMGEMAKKEFDSNKNYHKEQYYLNFCNILKDSNGEK